MDEQEQELQDRFSWQPGDLVKPAPQKRYILMRHDPASRNHAYLYDTASVFATYGDPASNAAIDIVAVRGDTAERADYLASYQLGRLQSGLESRSPKTFRSLEDALIEAERVAALLKGR